MNEFKESVFSLLKVQNSTYLLLNTPTSLLIPLIPL